MESPFYTNKGNVFTLYLEPILDSYSQTYIHVVTLSDIPQGPLSKMVKNMSLPKLSKYMSYGSYSGINVSNNCVYVLMKYPIIGPGVPKNIDNYMRSEDIPAIFSYLIANGYIINKDLTKMMNNSKVVMGGISDNRLSGNRKMICMVSIDP
jgi:hypothetical protein